MEENGEHNLVADIRKESRNRKFWLSHPIWNFSLSPPLSLDSRAKHRICEEIPANEVDHMEDKRVTGKGKEKNGMVEEAKHRKRNKKFPLMGKISPKDSKVLKFLFRKPRREHKSRDEVAAVESLGFPMRISNVFGQQSQFLPRNKPGQMRIHPMYLFQLHQQ